MWQGWVARGWGCGQDRGKTLLSVYRNEYCSKANATCHVNVASLRHSNSRTQAAWCVIRYIAHKAVDM